jgi:addiction module RelE/StbE family toxin
MRVTWARRAVDDLRAITSYIATDNARAAAQVASRIFYETSRLTVMPERGRMGRVAGTRELVFTPWPYIAVYRVAGEQIRVLRIRHAAQQWPQR